MVIADRHIAFEEIKRLVVLGSGCRVSRIAIREMEEFLSAVAISVSRHAGDLARYRGGKTVNAKDIRLARYAIKFKVGGGTHDS